ncbi:hypothetical protein [Candidatus Chloroploca asiatica]|nr:hypothetical protein [Candidatus Chloroploca asiatica]
MAANVCAIETLLQVAAFDRPPNDPAEPRRWWVEDHDEHGDAGGGVS